MFRRLISFIALTIAFTTALQAAEKAAESRGGSTAFAWGAEIGAGIDIGGHDMSDININAYLGLKNSTFPLLGAGVGIDMVMGNNCRSFPLFAVCRTNFGIKNAPCFGEMRIGCVFNDFNDGATKTSAYIAPGIGFNLACGKTFRSHLILSYIYNGIMYNGPDTDLGRIRGLNYINVSLGITFAH